MSTNSFNLMRPYQMEGIDFLNQRAGAMLFDEMGLGKTPQALLSVRSSLLSRVAIVCPNYAVGVWEDEIQKWLGDLGSGPIVIPVYGAKKQRQAGHDAYTYAVYTYNEADEILFYITTYQHIHELINYPQQLVIFDECHKISNPKTQAHLSARHLKTQRRIFLSGTPTRKNLAELWSYLRLIDPFQFRSYWRFVNTHFHTVTTQWGLEIVGPKNPQKLKEFLEPYMLRRLKRDVLSDLPDKQRQLISFRLSSNSRKLYNRFTKELLIENTAGDLILAPNAAVRTLRQRQLTVTPRLLGIEEDGEAIGLATNITEESVANFNSVVIFSVFAQALPYIEAALKNSTELKDVPIFQIHGGQSSEENTNQLQWFHARSGPAILLCTTSMAASWAATKASVAIFVGYSWSPIDNYQCEDRLHRFGQKNPVNVYYLGAKNTVDQHVVDVLDGKVTWQKLVLDPKRLLLPEGEGG